MLFCQPQGLWINVYRDNVACWADLLCDTYGEATRAASDVYHAHPRLEGKTLEGEAVYHMYEKTPCRYNYDKNEGNECYKIPTHRVIRLPLGIVVVLYEIQEDESQ